MSALKEYKPNTKDRNALKNFLGKNRVSKSLEEILFSVMENEDKFFYFLGVSEFSTQEAATILNVSRPFVIHLLDEGVIAFRKVGKHRRINSASLMKYKAKKESENKKILKELSEIAQRNNYGY